MSSQKSQNFNHTNSGQNSTTSDFCFSAGIEGSSKMMGSCNVLPTEDIILLSHKSFKETRSIRPKTPKDVQKTRSILSPNDVQETRVSISDKVFADKAMAIIDEVAHRKKKKLLQQILRTRNYCLRESYYMQISLRNSKLLRLVGLSGERWNSENAIKVVQVLKHHGEWENEINQSIEDLSENDSSEDSENENKLEDTWTSLAIQPTETNKKKSPETPDYIYQYPSDSEDTFEIPTNSCKKDVNLSVKHRTIFKKKSSSRLPKKSRLTNNTISGHLYQKKISGPIRPPVVEDAFLQDEFHNGETSDDKSEDLEEDGFVEIIEERFAPQPDLSDVTQVSELLDNQVMWLDDISSKESINVPSGCKNPPPKPVLGFFLGNGPKSSEIFFKWEVSTNPNEHEAVSYFEIYGYKSKVWEPLKTCVKSPLKYENEGHTSYAIRARDVMGRYSVFSLPVQINEVKANLYRLSKASSAPVEEPRLVTS